VNNDKIGR